MDAVLGVCLYLVNAVIGTWCQLMIMTWGDREGQLYCVFCNGGRVVDEKERDGNNVEDMGENQKSGVRLACLSWENLISV